MTKQAMVQTIAESLIAESGENFAAVVERAEALATKLYSANDYDEPQCKECKVGATVKHKRTCSRRFSLERLTDREKQVAYLVYEGKTAKDIAYQLQISISTAAAHRAHIYEKTGSKNVAELCRLIWHYEHKKEQDQFAKELTALTIKAVANRKSL